MSWEESQAFVDEVVARGMEKATLELQVVGGATPTPRETAMMRASMAIAVAETMTKLQEIGRVS